MVSQRLRHIWKPIGYCQILPQVKKKPNENTKILSKVRIYRTLENPNRQLTAGFILGDPDFVNWVKETFLSGRKDEKEIPQLKRLKPKVPLETVLKAVCEEFSCSEEQIITKGRKKNKAREVAIYLAREVSGMSGKDLGDRFGGVSGALITMMYNRIVAESAQNRRLKRRIEKTKKRIL